MFDNFSGLKDKTHSQKLHRIHVTIKMWTLLLSFELKNGFGRYTKY